MDVRPKKSGTLLDDNRLRTSRVITLPNGLKHPKAFVQRKKESENDFWLRVNETVKYGDDNAPGKKMRLDKALDLWEAHFEKKVESGARKQATIDSYKDATKIIRKHLGKVRLCNLTVYAVDDMLEAYTEKNTTRQRMGREVRAVLIRAEKWFLKHKWMTEPVAAHSDAVSYTPEFREQITASHALQAIEAMQHPVSKALALSIMQVGARPDEICTLIWPEVIEEDDGMWFRKTDAKSPMGKRPIPVPDDLADMIRALPRSSVFVFPSPKTKKAYVETSINRAFVRAQQRLKMTPVSIYSLRHLFAREKSKVERKEVVRRLMRHQDSRTTDQYYIDADRADLRKATK